MTAYVVVHVVGALEVDFARRDGAGVELFRPDPLTDDLLIEHVLSFDLWLLRFRRVVTSLICVRSHGFAFAVFRFISVINDSLNYKIDIRVAYSMVVN